MNPAKRNIVDGFSHMGDFYKSMPAISRFLEAAYVEGDLEEEFIDFVTRNDDFNSFQEEKEMKEDEDLYIYQWTLKGKHLNMNILFEMYEMLYAWYIICPDEATYISVKEFMDNNLG